MNKSYKDIFKSAAWYYARYRAGYPPAFFSLLKDKFNLTAHDRLLDLGCGTGQIAIPLAVYVKLILAMDPEPEMLAEGKIQADKAGVKNIEWLEGGSEDLADMADKLGKFKLVTIGTAFHWMNGEITLNTLYEMIEEGGGLVIAWGEIPFLNTPETNMVEKRWLGPERRAGSGFYKSPGKRFEDIVAESRFHSVQTWQNRRSVTSDVESIIGYFYSTSSSNLWVLGDKKEGFEKDLRAALLKQSPSGKFVSEGKVDALLAWK